MKKTSICMADDCGREFITRLDGGKSRVLFSWIYCPQCLKKKELKKGRNENEKLV